MSTPLRFEVVLAQYATMLARIVRAFEADRHAQEDLLQEVGLAVWRALPNLKQNGSVGAFVAQIAHHVAVEHVTRAGKRGPAAELSEQMIDPAAGPEQRTANEQTGERLVQAIRALPLDLAEVMVLQLEGFAQTEIAEMLGVSANLVGVRASRARDRLRQLMSPKSNSSKERTTLFEHSTPSAKGREKGAAHG